MIYKRTLFTGLLMLIFITSFAQERIYYDHLFFSRSEKKTQNYRELTMDCEIFLGMSPRPSGSGFPFQVRHRTDQHTSGFTLQSLMQSVKTSKRSVTGELEPKDIFIFYDMCSVSFSNFS
jgi:hypothetical protein